MGVVNVCYKHNPGGGGYKIINPYSGKGCAALGLSTCTLFRNKKGNFLYLPVVPIGLFQK